MNKIDTFNGGLAQSSCMYGTFFLSGWISFVPVIWFIYLNKMIVALNERQRDQTINYGSQMIRKNSISMDCIIIPLFFHFVNTTISVAKSFSNDTDSYLYKILLSLVLPDGQNDKNIRLAYWVDGVDIRWNYPSGNKVEKPLWVTRRCATGP